MSLMIACLIAQDFEVEGKAKVKDMDPATNATQTVTHKPDGTLSLRVSTTTSYSIGDFAQGGVVYWVSPDGSHGKVVCIYNAGAISWSNITNVEVGSAVQSDINGASNTVAITLQNGHNISAAVHYANLAYGGYDDWYLPSLDDLIRVYTKKDTINATAKANGGVALEGSSFWSSTELTGSNAWKLHFLNGFQSFDLKDEEHLVRAVRAF